MYGWNVFFSETRYTAQFQSRYEILSKYERNYDPVLAIEIFHFLWNYHKFKDNDDKEANIYARGIVAALTDPWNGDEYYFSDKGREEVEIIIEDLITNVKGMENLPVPWPMTEEEDGYGMTYTIRFRSGDPELVGDFLVPYKSWAKKYLA